MTKLRTIALQLIRGELPVSADGLAVERVKLCETCEDFALVSRQCKLCWCFIDLKTKILEAECPKGKW